MSENENIIYFKKLGCHLSAVLKSIGVIIDETEMEILLLKCLSDRFENLLRALDALRDEEDNFSLDLDKCRLQEEQRISMNPKSCIVKS